MLRAVQMASWGAGVGSRGWAPAPNPSAQGPTVHTDCMWERTGPPAVPTGSGRLQGHRGPQASSGLPPRAGCAALVAKAAPRPSGPPARPRSGERAHPVGDGQSSREDQRHAQPHLEQDPGAEKSRESSQQVTPRLYLNAALVLSLLPARLWFLTLPEPQWAGPSMHGARPRSGLQATVPRGCFWPLLGLRAPPGADPLLS